jgi:hypothetical protein
MYSDEENRGFPVFRASELPTNFPYGAVVTPDIRYHELWNAETTHRQRRAEKFISDNSSCLAVLCTAHI